MMFSPANRRFSLLIIAASAVCLGALAAVVAVETTSHERDTTGSQVRIVGFAGMLLAQLLLFVKAEIHERRASKGRHDLRDDLQTVAAATADTAHSAAEVAQKVESIERQTNGNLLAAVRQVAAEVRASERHQLITDPAFHAALKPIIHEIVREVCDERDGKH